MLSGGLIKKLLEKFSSEDMPKLTIALLAKSETDLLEKALDSARFADNIVIVLDSQYSPKTKEIAQRYKAKIFVRELDNFSGQKNYLLSNTSSRWVFLLDADEEITDELRKEIYGIIESNVQHNAYKVKRKNIIFNRAIRHTGWYPDWQTRLVKPEEVTFEGVVHEQIKVNGTTGRLGSDLTHHNYQSVEQFLRKQNIYSQFEADRIFRDGRRFSIFYLFGKPIKEFIGRYFISKGFLDGWHGLILSLLMAYYRVEVAVKLWEKQSNAPKK